MEPPELTTTAICFFCLGEVVGIHPRPRSIGKPPPPCAIGTATAPSMQSALPPCYLGPPCPERLRLEEAVGITREFAARGGLRLLISGGEPLLYPELPAFLNQTRDLGIRRILLTNGTLLTPENARRLQVEEAGQPDGWRRVMRPPGRWDDQTFRVSRPSGKPVCPSPSPPWFWKLMNSTTGPAGGRDGAIEWGGCGLRAGSLKGIRFAGLDEEAVPFLFFLWRLSRFLRGVCLRTYT
jgi:hypothetical protein